MNRKMKFGDGTRRANPPGEKTRAKSRRREAERLKTRPLADKTSSMNKIK
jgi:hypothetical protein